MMPYLHASVINCWVVCMPLHAMPMHADRALAAAERAWSIAGHTTARSFAPAAAAEWCKIKRGLQHMQKLCLPLLSTASECTTAYPSRALVAQHARMRTANCKEDVDCTVPAEHCLCAQHRAPIPGGRCAVCKIQKKGRCGTEFAHRNCLRRTGNGPQAPGNGKGPVSGGECNPKRGRQNPDAQLAGAGDPTSKDEGRVPGGGTSPDQGDSDPEGQPVEEEELGSDEEGRAPSGGPNNDQDDVVVTAVRAGALGYALAAAVSGLTNDGQAVDGGADVGRVSAAAEAAAVAARRAVARDGMVGLEVAGDAGASPEQWEDALEDPGGPAKRPRLDAGAADGACAQQYDTVEAAALGMERGSC